MNLASVLKNQKHLVTFSDNHNVDISHSGSLTPRQLKERVKPFTLGRQH